MVHVGLARLSGKYNYYYVCSGAFRPTGDKRCQNRRRLGLEKATDLVWEYIKSVLLNPNSLLVGLEQTRAQAEEARQAVAQRLARIDQLIARMHRKLSNKRIVYVILTPVFLSWYKRF